MVGLALLLLLTTIQGPVNGSPASWRGNRYRQQEDPIQRAKEIVQANPRSAQAYFELGTALQKSETQMKQ